MKKAEDIQIGGDHYKSWKIQPYKLMMHMNGPQSHILSYLLRTKNDDDLDKAIHWCDLMLEELETVTWEYSGSDALISMAERFIEINNITNNDSYLLLNNDSYLLLMALANNDYGTVKMHLIKRKESGLGGIKPCQM